jgi:hypothetical protein
MPPWKNTPEKELPCQACGKTFFAKRSAKFCSSACQNRARPKRPPLSKERVKELREKRMLNASYREKIRQEAKARSHRIRDWMDQYKLSTGCMDCGYREHPVALDFDHVRGQKMFNVCSAKSISAAEEEAKKCDVVCANCHRIRTARRLAVRH